jgi:hypothetical protein
MKRPSKAAGAALSLIILSFALPASAQVPQLNPIEQSTVRVFTCRSLSLERVMHEGREVFVAVPEVGHGSGMIITADGFILTARHVVQGASGLAVKLPLAKRAVPAVVVYEDPDLDFAFIKVQTDLPAYIPLPALGAAKTLATRDSLYSVGYPLDASASTPTTQEGIVSRITEDGMLQTSAALNPGHSGGPAFIDQRGRPHLIGIAIARHRVGEGMGLIMPIHPIVAAWTSKNVSTELNTKVMARYRQNPQLWQAMDRYSTLVAQMTEAFFDRDNPSNWFNMPQAGSGAPAFMDGMSELATQDMLPEAQLLVSGYLWNIYVSSGNEEALRRCIKIVMHLRNTQPDVFSRSSFAQSLARVIEARQAGGMGYGQPGYGQPGYGQPGYGQPGFGVTQPCGVEGGPCCGNTCTEGLSCIYNMCELPQECSREEPCAEGRVCSGGSCIERPHFPFFRMVLGGGIAVDNHPRAQAVDGGGVSFAGLFQVLRRGDRTPWRFALVVGGEMSMGGWRDLFAMTILADVGVRFLIGSPRIAATMAILYRLGLAVAEGRGAFAYLSYRAMAGLQLRNFEVGISWSETGRGEDYAFRMGELYLGWGY